MTRPRDRRSVGGADRRQVTPARLSVSQGRYRICGDVERRVDGLQTLLAGQGETRYTCRGPGTAGYRVGLEGIRWSVCKKCNGGD